MTWPEVFQGCQRSGNDSGSRLCELDVAAPELARQRLEDVGWQRGLSSREAVERLGADAEVAGQRREIRLGGAGRDGGAEGVGSGDDVIHFILFLSASRSTLGSASGWSASTG